MNFTSKRDCEVGMERVSIVGISSLFFFFSFCAPLCLFTWLVSWIFVVLDVLSFSLNLCSDSLHVAKI